MAYNLMYSNTTERINHIRFFVLYTLMLEPPIMKDIYNVEERNEKNEKRSEAVTDRICLRLLSCT